MRARLPLPIVALAAVGAAFVVVPVLALFVRAPWGQLIETLRGVGASTALGLSIEVSLAATAISLLVGVPLAYGAYSSGYYAGGCRSLRMRAEVTGSGYWWGRYQACLDGYDD